MKTRLIMTLLVRDEVDIIERNICFHLNQGVDFIVAADNGSVDGTLAILQKYRDKGVLSLQEIKQHTYEQSKWVSNLAKQAVEEQGASHLLHVDADEFWMSRSGNLKLHLPTKDQICNVPLLNYLPNLKPESFFEAAHYAVVKPYERVGRHRFDSAHRYLLNKHGTKVLTSAEHTEVAQGNHFVLTDNMSSVETRSILIHHFPIRSYQQFQQKVINGGTSYEKNPDKSPDIGWQRKEWYALYKAGLLESAYQEICINQNEQKILEYLGIIKRTVIPANISQAVSLFQKPPLTQKLTHLLGSL